ncbi:hypothetical protein KUW18_10180 [Halomonas sp. DP5Y7-2]|uniref:hypothetical protein n=1 Tax=Halomonas sp. DP5Y7-2 TaxID=2859076 RepID=UPI001C993CAE|nr:hypothetical protein [Halomonas sp. DP5Y7-2]MBY5984457.1 hypothetical protein [Halomonas sp. DP5Y7-2]
MLMNVLQALPVNPLSRVITSCPCGTPGGDCRSNNLFSGTGLAFSADTGDVEQPASMAETAITEIQYFTYDPLLSMYAQSISRITEMNSSAEQGSTIIWRKAAISDNGMG